MGLTRQEEEKELILIEDFKKGYVYFFSGFLNLVSSFQNYVTSGNISEANKRDLIVIRKSLDQELNKLQKRSKDIIINLDEKNLVPLARKEFSRFFHGIALDSSRLDFLQFQLIYEILKQYYVESFNGWSLIKRTVETAEFNEMDFKMNQLFGFRINPAFERLNMLEALLKRMGFILRVEKFQDLFDEKPVKPKFREEVDYRLSSVFAEDFYAGYYEVTNFNFVPTQPFSSTDNNSDAKPIVQIDTAKYTSNLPKDEGKVAPEVKGTLKTPPTQKLNSNQIDASGKFTWNSNHHYLFQYDLAKYNQERDYFKSTINMDLHMGADEQLLRSEFIRSMSSLDKKLKDPAETEKAYLDFLTLFFEFCQNIVMLHIGIPANLKWVFFFHIGPSHFYMIAKKFLTEANTGFLHIRAPDGKRVVRLIPIEVVKKHVIDYWNKSLLPNVGEEKNNLALLRKLIEIVEAKYKEASDNAMVYYHALPPEKKENKSIDLVFREHMSEWMGAANIIVYKRFVKNPIEV